MQRRSHLEEELRSLRGSAAFLDAVRGILEEEQKTDDVLRAMVLSSTKERSNRISGLDLDRVFPTDAIKRVATKYRLRFLDGGMFKGELPMQAIHELRQLEKRASAPLAGFKILAPAHRFKLCDAEGDPLLFLPLGNGLYYLVHQWGGDLAWHRALLNWPLRSAFHLAATVLLVAIVIAAAVPGEWVDPPVTAGYLNAGRFLTLFWTAMVLAGFTAFGWMAFFGKFSSEAWNSRHFN
ncbi:MAG: hypothetical protein IPG74_00770 [Flavobacteriales bacterium]|nr:hypothetical protein [Flavobacteriales bacterium]MBK9195513.1 hypothetical protein [Flavobacteriales bacterium]